MIEGLRVFGFWSWSFGGFWASGSDSLGRWLFCYRTLLFFPASGSKPPEVLA